jgi:CxxC-x17-CxxC domain-containing protein
MRVFPLTQFRHSYTFSASAPPVRGQHDAHPDTRQEKRRLLFKTPAVPLSSGPAIHKQGELIMSEGEVIGELETALEPEHPEHPDRNIKCVDCNENFIWTSGEQAFFHDKGLKNEPKRCKPCKQAKNERLAAITAAQTSGVRQRIEVSVQCAQCGQQTTVPFYPSQGRPVYCRSCFLAGRTSQTNSSASA